MKKTPRGEGYTQRVSGRRVLTSQLLEEDLEAAKKQLEELQQQNVMLRAKESMQLDLLESCELALGSMGHMAQHGPHGTAGTHTATLLSAALLDVQALLIKSQLQPVPDASAPVKEAQGALQSSFGSPQPASAAASSSDSAGTGMSFGSGAGEPPEEVGGPLVRRLLQSFTLQELGPFRDLTLAQLAERFRASVGRIALARQAQQRPQPGGAAPSVQQAVEDFAKLCLLSLVSNEPRHCRIIGLNLETLDSDPPEQQLWAECVEAAQLLPQQRQQICTAYQVHSQQQAQLLLQQQEVMQQLQDIMGRSAQPMQLPSSTAPNPAGPSSPAAAARPVAAASRSAHFMSLAAGAPTAEQQQLPSLEPGGFTARPVAAAALAQDAAWPLSSAAVPGAAAQPGTSSAALLRQAAAAAAVGGGCGTLPVRGLGFDGPLQQAGWTQHAAAAGQPGAGLAGPSGGPATSSASGGCSSTSTAAGSSSCNAGTSSASSSLQEGPVGVLPLEDAERAEQLLQQLMRTSVKLKQQCRSLSTLLMNMVSPEQSADVTLAAYPYILNVPAFCACVAGAPAPKEARQG